MSGTTAEPSDSAVRTVTPEEYTRADEEFLRRGEAVTRTAVLSTAALSVGVSQREDAPCVLRARRLGIPVVRRSTGGLGLWHAPGDVVWSLILPRSDARVGNDFSKAYARLGAGPVRLLADLGIPSDWRAPSGPPSEHCLLSGRGAVLAVGGLALGGAAQHLTRLALLHHGVLPYRLDPPRLFELFELPADVVVRSLTSLEKVVYGVPPMEVARRLRSILARGAEPRSG
ncbi:MAG: hypothetical protein L3J97_06005 [Thermoplasmata archaeon]|nr:hypothetical protein [Thermoplasmata archaeon]